MLLLSFHNCLLKKYFTAEKITEMFKNEKHSEKKIERMFSL